MQKEDKKLLEILIWILLFFLLLGCLADNRYVLNDECQTIPVVVDIQHEVVESIGEEAAAEVFYRAWQQVVMTYHDIGIDLQLQRLMIWTEPDTFSTADNTCDRLQENYDNGSYASGVANIVMGSLWGGCAWVGWKDGHVYTMLPGGPDELAIEWTSWFMAHEIGHMLGAWHTLQGDCSIMISGYCDPGAIPYNVWHGQSVMEITQFCVEWCADKIAGHHDKSNCFTYKPKFSP